MSIGFWQIAIVVILVVLLFGRGKISSLMGDVATSLDGQEPETKPVVSMVHRLQNRNVGYGNNLTSTLTNNQATLNATEGATALNLNNIVEEKTNFHKEVKQEDIQQSQEDSSLKNISIENATYLQNLENANKKEPQFEENIPTFEVDSIELATPELFSDNLEDSSFNQDHKSEMEPKIFDGSNSTKEPEMFEESNVEEDFEIPAFLRRQRN